MPSVFISYSHDSADQFIPAALTCFGDPDPTQGSPWDKGERLESIRTRIAKHAEICPRDC